MLACEKAGGREGGGPGGCVFDPRQPDSQKHEPKGRWWSQPWREWSKRLELKPPRLSRITKAYEMYTYCFEINEWLCKRHVVNVRSRKAH